MSVQHIHKRCKLLIQRIGIMCHSGSQRAAIRELQNLLDTELEKEKKSRGKDVHQN
jgi:hypothetical protein